MSNITPFNKPYREHVSPSLDARLIAVKIGKGFFNEYLLTELRRLREERDGGSDDAA